MKELQYFTRFWHEAVPDDFAERYYDYFPRPEGAITGEWTPRYMFDHWSMRLLRAAAPDAKVLLILRDPIERYRSALAAWRPSRGRQRQGLDALAAAVARSAYADQLRGVFARFPRDQVLVLQYEKCRADTEGQMLRTWEFLGLDPNDRAIQGLPEETRAPRPKPELDPEVRADLVARLSRDVSDVASLCPEIDITLWRNFA